MYSIIHIISVFMKISTISMFPSIVLKSLVSQKQILAFTVVLIKLWKRKTIFSQCFISIGLIKLYLKYESRRCIQQFYGTTVLKKELKKSQNNLFFENTRKLSQRFLFSRKTTLNGLNFQTIRTSIYKFGLSVCFFVSNKRQNG